MTYVGHDHREGESICFAACSLLIQDLWNGPSHSVIRILNDRCLVGIRDPCTAGDIHKDFWLVLCQYSGETELRIIAYPLQITVDYVTGVEKAKAFSGVG